MDTNTIAKGSALVQVESDLMIRTADWMARARYTIQEQDEEIKRLTARYNALCKQVGIEPAKD